MAKAGRRQAKRSGESLLGEGIALFNEGRFADAVRVFRAAVDRGAAGEDASCFLAHALACAGDPGTALRFLEARLSVSPDPAALLDAKAKILQSQELGAGEKLLLLGESLYRKGELADAEPLLREAAAAHPDPARARFLLGLVLEARGSIPEALRSYEEALRLDPGQDQARLSLVKLRLSEGGIDDTLAWLTGLLRAGVRDAASFLLLADRLTAQGRLEEGRRWLESVAQVLPGHPEVLFSLGALCLQAELRAPAEAAFRRYLEVGEDGRPYRRFIALMAAGEFAACWRQGEAILDLGEPPDYDALFEPWFNNAARPHPDSFYAERAAALAGLTRRTPRSPWPWFYHGLLLCRLKRPLEGLSALDALTDFDGRRYGWMRHAAGTQRLWLGRVDEAVDDLQAAVASMPTAWWSRGHLAEARLARGEDSHALEELAEAERACGRGPRREIRAWRGELLLWLGRYEEALQELDAAHAEGCSLAACWRGGANMLLGRSAAALADLDLALAAGARDAEALVFRGELERRLGRPEAAARYLEQGREAGNDIWANVNLALLHADSGDPSAMWGCLERLPPDMTQALLERTGRTEWRKITPDEVRRMMELALKMARGIRRSQRHLQSLWLRR